MQRNGQQPPSFDSILKRGLERRRQPGDENCPDDATLAAFCERSLPPSERTYWEAHFSGCARCQAMLAAMARAHSAIRATTARSGWRRWQPYAALAAGVAGISIAVGLLVTNYSRDQMRLAVRIEPAAPAHLAKQEQRGDQAANPQIALNEPMLQANPAPRAPSYGPSEVGHPEAPNVPGRFGLQAERKLAETISPGNLGKMARPGTTVEAEAPPPPPPAPLVMNERGAGAFGLRSPASGRPAASAAAASSEVSDAGAPANGLLQAMVSVRTPDGIERWRLAIDGIIQHLGNDGRWHRQSSGVSSALTAGSAPSPQVCWMVGAGGTILRTTDGEHWQKLNSPTTETLLAVSAIDAATAAVTTADGQRFTTADGGRTWRPM